MPLIAVNTLVSGQCLNEIEGPSKMPMLFIGPNSLLNEEESLFLALKLAEGKGFSDDAISSLLKKELHMTKNYFELKEHFRYITVFHILFNGSRKATKEINVCFVQYRRGKG